LIASDSPHTLAFILEQVGRADGGRSESEMFAEAQKTGALRPPPAAAAKPAGKKATKKGAGAPPTASPAGFAGKRFAAADGAPPPPQQAATAPLSGRPAAPSPLAAAAKSKK
jgi:hypothetical protein